MLKNLFLAFVPIFVAVDALGMLPIFISLTARLKKSDREDLIRQSTVTALLVSLSFLWVGKLVFLWLGITFADFLVAGGAVLFILSIRDLLTFGKKIQLAEGTIGVIPLAVPLIVGPAVLASSLISLSSFGWIPSAFALVSNIVLCGVVLHFSSGLSRFLGETGSNTLSKISNLLLAAIGVMLVRRGILEILTSWLASS